MKKYTYESRRFSHILPVTKFFLAGLLFITPLFSYSQDFDVGVNIHLRYYPKSASDYLKLIKDTGFTSYRAEYPWSLAESKSDGFGVAERLKKEDCSYQNGKSKYNLNALMILGSWNAGYTEIGGYPRTQEAIDAYVNYATWTASRFKGKVKYYEIWNEWIVGTGIHNKERPPSPDFYLELVKRTSAAIKKVDPNAIVMAGSFNPLAPAHLKWFERLMEKGILDSLDGISLHPYSYKNNDMALRNPEANLAAIDLFEAKVKKYSHREIPIYITEIGVPTYDGEGGVSDDEAAQYIIKYTLLSKARSYIKGIWWYDLIDDGDNPKRNEHRFGFFNRKEKPKSAAVAYEKIADVVKSYTVNDYRTTPAGVISISLTNSSNKHAMLYWKKTPVAKNKTELSDFSFITNRNVSKENSPPKVEYFSEHSGNELLLKGGVPILVRSDKKINPSNIKSEQ